MDQLDINALFQVVTVGLMLLGLAWRLPSKDDIKRLDDRIDSLTSDMKAGFAQQDAKIEERFAQQDAKFEARFAQQDAKFEARFAQQDAKFEARFAQQDKKFDKLDTKIDDLRLEIKSDIQRVEDRAAEANEFHAKSVALLDGILRQLQERREPL
ncbi:MAG: hypothetical protein OXT68_13260 [Chloroflexota bacterium]|nr:hypothetical protein [Chloroflexota bacterium]MDE2951717.1 hypothetical protein [Chloroflexota bacterium]